MACAMCRNKRDGYYLVCKRGQPVKSTPHPFPFSRPISKDMKGAFNWVKIGDKVLLADYANNKMYRRYGKKDNV